MKIVLINLSIIQSYSILFISVYNLLFDIKLPELIYLTRDKLCNWEKGQ